MPIIFKFHIQHQTIDLQNLVMIDYLSINLAAQ